MENTYERGQIDPCDDIPAFLKLSAVCEAALKLNPDLKVLEDDPAFLYRPGEKLIWAANQQQNHKRSQQNEKDVAKHCDCKYEPNTHD